MDAAGCIRLSKPRTGVLYKVKRIPGRTFAKFFLLDNVKCVHFASEISLCDIFRDVINLGELFTHVLKTVRS